MVVVAGVNDLKTYCEKDGNTLLLDEWDYERNFPIAPEDVYFKASKKYYWKCQTCGNTWVASVGTRVAGHGCKICGYGKISDSKKKTIVGENDLETLFPLIAKEWDYEKNSPYTPKDVKPNSEKLKPWWICPQGHSYQASLTNRTHNNSGCPFCDGKMALPGFNDLLSRFPEIAQEWDYEKNNGLTPDQVTFGSKKKVWWICPKGHQYEATVNNRTANMTGCPVCKKGLSTSLPEQAILFYLSKKYTVVSRYKIGKREADIFLPDYKIAIEYDGFFYHSSDAVIKKDQDKDRLFAENGITLIRVKEIHGDNHIEGSTIFFDGSQGYKQIDWAIKCLNGMLNCITGNEYECAPNLKRDRIEILSRFRGYEKEQNLCDTNVELTKEWDYEKNGKLRPEFYTAGSPERVWWKCNNNHSWKATIASRAKGHGCPYCAGRKHIKGINDLASANPEIAREWDYAKNGNMSPDRIAKGSHEKVWWICPNGHSYQASPLNRTNATNHTGCPYCSNKKVLTGYNDLQTVLPEIAEEWDYSKNGSLKPTDLVYGSAKKVWWKCRYCGHEWNCRVLEKKNGRKCPNCHK